MAVQWVSVMEALSVYIPIDRQQAMARSQSLPDRVTGAALFADISGFTPLTEALVNDLGPQRGSEEITGHLNRVYDALITELHRYGGSVISFAGDAITCWFNESDSVESPAGLRALTCALAMQTAMKAFAAVRIPSGRIVSLAMKVAVATGPVRRFVVGDPQIQLIDVLAGATLTRLTEAEHLAEKDEVIVDAVTATALGEAIQIRDWRRHEETGNRCGVVAGLTLSVSPAPWPPIPSGSLHEEAVRPWLLKPVYERLRTGQGDFLAELRPVVVMFTRFGGIDYDGDDEAGRKLDADIRRLQTILARYEGSLLQLTIGDKGSYLYSAFGAPLAHEDDVLRAASAALDLQAAELGSMTDMQIGISQSRMRTGAYGGAERRTYGVLGDEVNVAARLMQAARPGQIIVNKAALPAMGDAFVWEDMPDLRVKGKAEPVAVLRLVGLQTQRAVRLQEVNYTLPMVGREAELAAIEARLKQAARGEGQIVGITGEAGIGKSRLLAEVVRLANEQGFTGYGGECQSYGLNISYLVWHPIWRSFFGIDPNWELEKQTRVLTRQMRTLDRSLLPRLPLLDAALNIPLPDNELTRSFDAKLRKVSLEGLLVECLRARTEFGSLLLVLEDCHWIDPLSHDLLEEIGRAVADLPVLMVLSYRPLQVSRGEGLRISALPHFAEVRLTDFSPLEAERLISLKLERFFGSRAHIPPDFVTEITQRAQGNPFYIEELLNYLHDRKIEPQQVEALGQLDLPASLHSLILSRIDQLTENQKTTLKVASVVGRLFQAAVLWGVYPQLGDLETIKQNLAALERLDLTPMDVPEPELVYIFKHVITQEVAYESLPFATRETLHELIGQYLERVNADALDQQIDLLAHHYGRSRNEDKKREYLLKAGDAARERYANKPAIDYYERALAMLPPQEQMPVLLKLGGVLELVGRRPEAGDRYREALALAEGLGDRQARAQCQAAIAELLWKQNQYSEAAAWLERAQAIFQELGDQAGVAQTLHYGGTLAAQQGEYEKARSLYEAGLALRRTLDDRPGIASLLNNLGIVARFQGDSALARSLNEESLSIRRSVGDRRMIANSLNNLGNVFLDQGQYAEARTLLEEAVALQREVGDRAYIANALNTLADVVRAQGDYARARGLYQESLAISRELGERVAIAYLLESIGCLEALQGQPERALLLVGAASALREEIGAPLSPTEKTKLEALLAPARQSLDEEKQSALAGEGRNLSLTQAIEYALNEQ